MKKKNKKGKKVKYDNLDDEKMEHLEKEDNKRKKKPDNLYDNKREQMEKEDNKRKKKTMAPWVIMEKNS